MGVPSIMVSPPRAERGEPQPGRSRNMSPSMTTEVAEKIRPIRPRLMRCGLGTAAG